MSRPWFGKRLLEAVSPRRIPFACLALMAANLVMFLGAELWGGSASFVTLKRMGAGLAPAALGAEAWRLLSAGFLHVSREHLLTNLGVLLLGGMYLEGLLGPSRLLLLYALSILVPNILVVSAFSNVFLVGASGGIFGVTGALLVLACAPYVALPLRRRIAPLVCALVAVALAVRVALVCGQPPSNAAHFSGLTLGMVLALGGVLTWRLPRPGARELPLVRRGASVAGWVMGACLVVALVWERPWELRTLERMVRVRVPGTSLSLAVPTGAARRTQVESATDTEVRLSLGEPFTDMLVVQVTAERLEEAVSAESLEEDTRALNDKLFRESTEEAFLQGWGPWVQRLGGQPAVYSGRSVGSLFWADRWSMYRGHWLLTVEVFRGPGLPRQWEPLVREVAWSVALDEPGAPPWDSCAAWNPVRTGVCPPGGGW